MKTESSDGNGGWLLVFCGRRRPPLGRLLASTLKTLCKIAVPARLEGHGSHGAWTANRGEARRRGLVCLDDALA